MAPRSRLKYSNTVDALGKQRIRFMPQRHPDADTTCDFFFKKKVCTIQKKVQREHVAQRRMPSYLCGSFFFNFYFLFFLGTFQSSSRTRSAGMQRRRSSSSLSALNADDLPTVRL